jgi:hypothetical protein
MMVKKDEVSTLMQNRMEGVMNGTINVQEANGSKSEVIRSIEELP